MSKANQEFNFDAHNQQNQVGDNNHQTMNNGDSTKLPDELLTKLFGELEKQTEKKDWTPNTRYAVKERYPKPKDLVKEVKSKIAVQTKPKVKPPAKPAFKEEQSVWEERLKALKPVVDFSSSVGKAALEKFVDKSPVAAALMAACDFFQKK